MKAARNADSKQERRGTQFKDQEPSQARKALLQKIEARRLKSQHYEHRQNSNQYGGQSQSPGGRSQEKATNLPLSTKN